VGGTAVGNRDKWYMMETKFNIPTTPGIYQVVIVPGPCNVIRPGKNLSEDVTDGYVDGLRNMAGDTLTIQAGAGAAPAGYPPDAVLVADVTYGAPPLTIRFEGTGSTDFNGGEMRFEWDFGDGSAIDTHATAVHTYSQAGYFTARLRVTDEEGLNDVDEQVIAVGVNAPPAAVARADVHYGTAPLRVNFDGLDSTDPEGDSLVCYWEFGDGGAAFGPTPSHVFDRYGSYDVQLTVTDPDGLTDRTTVNVLLANQAPSVGFAMSAVVGEAPIIVDFDGNESFDPDDDPMTFTWDFGDGEFAGGPSARHLYRTPGVYNIVLDVADDKGNSRSVGRSLRVLLPDGRVSIPQANNKIPSVGLSAGPTKGPAPLTVTFGLSGADPDGDEVSVILDPGNGELMSDLAPGQTATYTYATEGDYTAEAMSFDGRGGTAKTHIAVTVLPPVAAASSDRSSRGICGAGVAQISVPAMAAILLLFAVRRRR
jgi:PKD repeat protein